MYLGIETQAKSRESYEFVQEEEEVLRRVLCGSNEESYICMTD